MKRIFEYNGFWYNKTMNEKTILTKIEQIVRECGKNLLRHDIKNINAKTSVRDVVTEFDLENQNLIIDYLSKAFPEAGFFSEESAADSFPTNDLVFVIDPIDGTMNFTKNTGYSCISVACFKDRKPFVGVVYNPYRDEIFTATLNGGAFCNGEPITVTDQPLSNCLVQTNTSSYYPSLLDDSISRITSILPKCIDIRIQGSAALDMCQAAAGRVGLYFESRISLWDYAAAALILTEAGGEILTLEGAPVTYDIGKTSIIAGPANLIKESGLLRS